MYVRIPLCMYVSMYVFMYVYRCTDKEFVTRPKSECRVAYHHIDEEFDESGSDVQLL